MVTEAEISLEVAKAPFICSGSSAEQNIPKDRVERESFLLRSRMVSQHMFAYMLLCRGWSRRKKRPLKNVSRKNSTENEK